jgi:hypothetical protein
MAYGGAEVAYPVLAEIEGQRSAPGALNTEGPVEPVALGVTKVALYPYIVAADCEYFNIAAGKVGADIHMFHPLMLLLILYSIFRQF